VEVLSLASGNGIDAIEWADSHVPRGEFGLAAETMMDTLRAGLSTAAYRSSFRFTPGDDGRFATALATARALHSPKIVAWAPARAYTSADEAKFADAARRAGDEAGKTGVTLCLELERGSWLSGYREAARIVAAVDHPFVRLCWVPFPGDRFDQAMEGLDAANGLVALIKARAWDRKMGRHRMERFGEDWMYFMEEFHRQAGDPKMTHYVLIHSVRRDDEAELAADVAALRAWTRALARERGERVVPRRR
jgi:hypothetical protein